MNVRDISTELQRLRQLAKALVGAIEQLQERIDTAPVGGRTVPPPARPTTRIRRVGGKPPVAPTDDAMPATPRAGGGYRFTTSPKKR